MVDKYSCKDIYDYTLFIEEENKKSNTLDDFVSEDERLFNSLIRIVENEERSYAIKILGINEYLECKKYVTGFRREDMKECCSVFNEMYPEYKNEDDSKKIKFLEAMVDGKYEDLKKKFSYFICKMNNFSIENIETLRRYNKMRDSEEREFEYWMNNDINLFRDIYELSVGLQPMIEEKSKRYVKDDELIFRSLRILLASGTDEEKKKILGEDPNIDYNILKNKFTYLDIEDNLEIFDEAIPGMKDEVLSEKVSFLEKLVCSRSVPIESSFTAVKLIKKYFSDKKEVEQMMGFYRNELM